MNVFVYQGMDRNNATVPVNGNNQLVVGRNYTVPYNKGMFLVAYPNKDVDTEFEFEYYIGEYSSFMNNLVIIIVAVVVGILLICMVCCCCLRRSGSQGKIEIADTDAGKDVEQGSLELTDEQQPS